MSAEISGNDVRANCPDCGGAITTFEHRAADREFGTVILDRRRGPPERPPGRVVYRLLRCAGCGRGGLSGVREGQFLALEDFHPSCSERAALPIGVPDEVVKDYREAELCASVGAFRGASALLRSAIEKVLEVNGYKERNLHTSIEVAAKDGLITAALESRAKSRVKDLGNDILHDPWFPVTAEEYKGAHGYVLRIVESFYDDRQTVEALLKTKNRLPP